MYINDEYTDNLFSVKITANLRKFLSVYIYTILNDIWRPPSLSKLTLIIFNMELTHLGSNVQIWRPLSLSKLTPY